MVSRGETEKAVIARRKRELEHTMRPNGKQGSLKWQDLKCDLHGWIQEAIKSMGFGSMTPVQASTIPLLVGNKDVVVEAVTGSGKTLAYLLPILHRISKKLYGTGEDEDNEKEVLKKGHMWSVIMAPTRELAKQIEKVFKEVVQYLPPELEPIRSQLLIGTLSSVRDDVDDFLANGAHVVIGTPGRLFEFLSSKHVKTKAVEIVVLDEADRLLDISFERDVVSALKLLPKQRRTGLFSATLSSAGDSIFKTGMSNPVRVSVKSNSSNMSQKTPTSLKIGYMLTDAEKKTSILIELLQELQFKKSIVYFPTCASVSYFYNVFTHIVESDLRFFSLHGKLSAGPRLKTLQKFSEGESSLGKYVLMTTDVAARGIDIPDVDLVIQLEPPTDPDQFVHRCGRTGRNNKSGQAIVMLNDNGREEGFVTFMNVRGLEMNPIQAPEATNEYEVYETKIRNFVLGDRAIHDMALKAYVSFVRYYSKHSASSIFRIQDLDYVAIAKMYGLLRLPKMPELKYIAPEKMPSDGYLIDNFDFNKFSYADKKREKARVESMDSVKEKKKNDALERQRLLKKNEAWSAKTSRKEKRLEKREKLTQKRKAIEQSLLQEPSDEEAEVDWKELVQMNKRNKKNSEVSTGFEDL